MKKVLLLSFDAVGSDELPLLQQLPNFQKLSRKGRVFPNLQTSFITNTYPVHTSLITGTDPQKHRLISNVEIDPTVPDPHWCYDSRLIKSCTIWQAAHRKGLRVASVMWPVTAYAKEIDWNIPEIMIQKGENQVLMNLRTGSKLLQLVEYFRHHKLLRGAEQPERDRFATACMCDIIRQHRPDLILLHLTAYDSICHVHGRNSAPALQALAELDQNLGRLMAVVDDETVLIVFSDHAQLNVEQAVDPNQLLQEMGLLRVQSDSSLCDLRAFFQNAEGSAFFFRRGCSEEEVMKVKEKVLTLDGVERLLTAQEMERSGYEGLAEFGVAAKIGSYFSAHHHLRASHGYPADYPDYQVFAAFSELESDIIMRNLLDVSAIVLNKLNIELK